MMPIKISLVISILSGVFWPHTASARQMSADKMIQLLHHKSYKIRLKAAIQIGKSRMRRGAYALKAALEDDHVIVRAAAALSLGQLGDQKARPRLVKMLGSPKALVGKAAEKALVLLDQNRGRPRYLLWIAGVNLGPSVAERAGVHSQRAIEKRLKKASLLVMNAGEDSILNKKKLRTHLLRRRLTAKLLRPRVSELSAKKRNSETLFVCKVSIMIVDFLTNRMEFTGTGKASAEVGETGLDREDIIHIKNQVLDAATQAALDEIVSKLARGT
jgi:hypothetical protein